MRDGFAAQAAPTTESLIDNNIKEDNDWEDTEGR